MRQGAIGNVMRSQMARCFFAFLATFVLLIPGSIEAQGKASRIGFLVVGSAASVSNRVDDLNAFGGGIGYHLGRNMRLGLDIDQSYRWSDVSTRQYNNLRFGSSVTYGF